MMLTLFAVVVGLVVGVSHSELRTRWAEYLFKARVAVVGLVS